MDTKLLNKSNFCFQLRMFISSYLLIQRWFMGPLSAQDADKLIEPLPGKPFLVRFSSSNGKSTSSSSLIFTRWVLDNIQS